MHANVAMRPFLWDKAYAGIPPTPVTAETVPSPISRLVVAGDVIYNGVHMYLGQSVVVGGFGPWRDAIDKVEALKPRHIVAGHQNKQLDDDARRTIAETGSTSTTPTSCCGPRTRPSTSQRQDRAVPEPPRADRPVGGCERSAQSVPDGRDRLPGQRDRRGARRHGAPRGACRPAAAESG